MNTARGNRLGADDRFRNCTEAKLYLVTNSAESDIAHICIAIIAFDSEETDIMSDVVYNNRHVIIDNRFDKRPTDYTTLDLEASGDGVCAIFKRCFNDLPG